jgi:membrane protein DedA with SNARE-associated domain
MRTFWKVHYSIHIISGTIIMGLTIALGIVGIKLVDWELNGEDVHHIIGLIVFFAVVFVGLIGIYARNRTRRLRWNT